MGLLIEYPLLAVAVGLTPAGPAVTFLESAPLSEEKRAKIE